MTLQTLEIGFELPFSTHLAPARADGVPRIEVRAASPLGATERRVIEVHLEVFGAGAMYGMGADSTVAPVMPAGSLAPGDYIRVAGTPHDAHVVSVELPGLVMGAHYAVVLLHTLHCLHEQLPIAAVRMELPAIARDPLPVRRADRSALPPLYQPLPFSFDADLYNLSESLNITLSFSRPPDAAELGILDDGCSTWAALAIQGGYISPPIDCDNHFLAPAETLLVAGDEVRWLIDECAIAVTGLFGLVHFFCAFSQRCVPLREVAIE